MMRPTGVELTPTGTGEPLSFSSSDEFHFVSNEIQKFVTFYAPQKQTKQKKERDELHSELTLCDVSF